MADLHVQPKKSSGSILPWVLLGLGLLALIIFLARGCNDKDATDDTTVNTTTTTIDTATSSVSNSVNNGAQGVQNWWDDVDFNAPTVAYDEITNKDVEVRGNNNYGIYGIGENILFDENKSTIRSGAEANLQQIASSIDKRYANANVRIYGYTDAVGSAGYNKELSEQRAQAVRNWLQRNGKLTENRLSIHAVGEARPAASNNTEAGRQQNRRVEIVAGNASGNTQQ